MRPKYTSHCLYKQNAGMCLGVNTNYKAFKMFLFFILYPQQDIFSLQQPEFYHIFTQQWSLVVCYFFNVLNLVRVPVNIILRVHMLVHITKHQFRVSDQEQVLFSIYTSRKMQMLNSRVLGNGKTFHCIA